MSKLDIKFKDTKLPVNYDHIDSFMRRNVREEYVRVQKGLCWFCKKPLGGESKYADAHINLSLFPPLFFKYQVHLHHDHNTGMTIGAVHCHCNAYLWQYEGE